MSLGGKKSMKKACFSHNLTLKILVMKTGRPTKFTPEIAEKICALYREGKTDSQVAESVGLAKSTIRVWKEKDTEFKSSIKALKSEADDKVERALYERALGYSHQDVDIRTVSVGDGCSQIVQTPMVKHYPPDPTSMIFWLKNRRREAWRDKQDVEVSGKDGAPIEIELIVAARRLAKEL
jgi:hypothetical protein